MRTRILRTSAVAMAVLGLVQPALAVLDSVGPVDPTNGYPAWYMDRNGLALELCVNQNADVLAAGGCVILPAAPPEGVLTVPEVLPNNWAMEHFYTLATMVLDTAGVDKNGVGAAGAGRVTIGMGVEASFATPVPTVGEQIVFNRWRVFHTNAPCTGNYTYYTPYNVPQTFSATSGGRIFETSDIGVGDFAGPLAGTTGPFLMWSDSPGGPAKDPYVASDGKRYVSDFTAPTGTAVTGSAIVNPLLASTKAWIPAAIKAMPYNNYILIEGPGIATGNCAATESVSSSNTFEIFGRYFEGAIPSPTKVDRATFTAVDSNADGTPDTFRVGVWAHGQRRAGTAVTPVMDVALITGDPLAPTGATAPTTMTSSQLGATVPGVNPKYQFFQTVTTAKPAAGAAAVQARPAAGTVQVRVTTDTPVTTLNVPLVDEVNIDSAVWDSSLKTLTVVAESGAFLAAVTPASQTATNSECSVPCLTLDRLSLPATADDGTTRIDYKLKSQGSKYAIMKAVIPNVDVPPDTVTVTSSMGGRDTQPVMYSGVAVGTGLAIADSGSTPMNVPVTIPVLINDVGVLAVPNLQICTAATAGTCAVPNPATACVVNTVSPQCTASGGRLVVTANNEVSYTPKAGVGGTSETIWYQVSTLTGLRRAPVTITIGSVSGLPDALDDSGITSVVNKSTAIPVLTNDFAPAGIDMATLQVVSAPCTAPTLAAPVSTCTTASFDAQGRMVFTPTTVGTWSMQYTFSDVLGNVADRGVVTVNAVAGETLTVAKALFKVGKAPALGNIIVDGTSTVLLNHTLELRVPNAATGPQGCSNPTAGSRIALASSINGVWAFGATALAKQPPTVYVYSPDFGACLQATVTLK